MDWWPWSDDAFAEARRRDVPVLISVGYAACHWCHVMAHESFENEAIAAAMNANFVAIKVDREERPDVDAVYMTATQAMTGQGGWPMTVFATPDGEPFYCGTYFPRAGVPAAARRGPGRLAGPAGRGHQAGRGGGRGDRRTDLGAATGSLTPDGAGPGRAPAWPPSSTSGTPDSAAPRSSRRTW